MIDHLLFNRQKYYPFAKNPTGHYVITVKSPYVSYGKGISTIDLTISKDGSIAITKAMEDGLEIDTPQITKTN